MTPGSERRSGYDRRDGRSVVVYRRNAVLEITQALTALLAVVALVFALVSFSDRLDEIQASRFAAARDSCVILNTLVLAATPRGKLPLARAYIERVGLADCRAYAARTVHAHH